MTDKLSPMMKQYMEIKAQYQDCILFFRLGDFYEMFFDDAYTASRELELTLTGKNCGQEERAPMCGVPFHAADMYIARLVEKGYKVAICEQVEDPSTAKGIVAREVIRIITPGTLTPEMMIPEGENNYLLSIAKFKDGLGLSYCDISTGELAVTEILDSRNSYGEAIDKIARLSPKEVLVNKAFDEIYGTEDIESVSVEKAAEEGTVNITVTATYSKDVREDVSLALSSEKISIFEMKEDTKSLEDVFLELTAKEEE